MKTLLLCTLLSFAQGGETEKGLQLYREGRFREAAEAFAAAIAAGGDSAELQYNLALARWRAGEFAAAETAAEKYAALAPQPRADLHRGLLGAVRYDEAKQLEAEALALAAGPPAPPAQAQGATEPQAPPDPLPLLEQALQKANQAKDHFVQGVLGAPSPELQRNAERTLRYLGELQKKIDELKKQREQQPKQDEESDENNKDENKDEKPDEKKDEPKDDKKDDKSDAKKDQKPDEKQQPDDKPQKPDEPSEQPKPGEGEEKPEPKPEEKEPQPAEPKPDPQSEPPKGEGEQKPEAKPEEQPKERPAKPEPGKRTDAPGEVQEGKELSPEQAQRLLETLQQLDQQLKALRARGKTQKKPVERDW